MARRPGASADTVPNMTAPTPSAVPPIPHSPVRGRHYKYYDLVMAAFVVVLLCSNLIGPGKFCGIELGARIIPDWTQEKGFILTSVLVFGAGNIFFPIGYVFGDVLTEVYGYARSRKVIWAGFGGMIFASIMALVIVKLPVFINPNNAGEGGRAQAYADAVSTIFSSTWRVTLASLIAFWVGDFVNSLVLAKMKVLTRGRWLWTRTIGSTIVGQFCDSLIFYPGAFYDGTNGVTIAKVCIFNWIFKVMVEVVMTPATYAICGFLKRAENEDFYDTDTDFTPFSLKD